MDSMVRTALAIEREIDDARNIRDTGAGDKRKRVSLLRARERSKVLLFYEGFQDRVVAFKAKARSRILASQDR